MRARDLSGPTSLSPDKPRSAGSIARRPYVPSGGRRGGPLRRMSGCSPRSRTSSGTSSTSSTTGPTSCRRSGPTSPARRRRGRDARRTVENLEELPQGALEYFRPAQLAAGRMPGARRGRGRWSCSCGRSCAAGRCASTDAERLGASASRPDRSRRGCPPCSRRSRRRLTEQAPAGSGVHVGQRSATADGIEVVFRVEGGFGAPVFRSAVACLEWALAERIVGTARRLLRERRRAAADRPRSCSSLPFASLRDRGCRMETRILIVDDDPFICRQLEELYTSQQYAGRRAAERVRRRCACSASTTSRSRSSTSRFPAPTASASRARSASAGPTSTSS